MTCRFSIVHEREVKNNTLDCYVLGDRGKALPIIFSVLYSALTDSQVDHAGCLFTMKSYELQVLKISKSISPLECLSMNQKNINIPGFL